MNWETILLIVAAVVGPPVAALRAYRIGYQAGAKGDKLREILRNRYSKPGRNNTGC